MNNEYRPYTLIAELTYRCPLRCPYCSNPLGYAGHGNEVDTDTWLRVFQEAETLGVVQLNLTGGEPLLRDDLELFIEKASRLELYTNLITSGIPLTFERLSRFRALGLNSVQLSIQSTRPTESDRIAGTPSFHRKLEVMQWVTSLGLPLTMNVVLHRDNIGEISGLYQLWPSTFPPTDSSWRTRSTLDGLSRTARRCCRLASKSRLREPLRLTQGNGFGDQWK